MAGLLFFEPAAYVILGLYAIAMSLVHARADTSALAIASFAMAIASTTRLVREARRVGRGTSLQTFAGPDPSLAARMIRLLTLPVAWVAFTFLLARFAPFAHAFMSGFGWSVGLTVLVNSTMARASRVVLGGDGVRVERFRSTRFVRYADIASVHGDENESAIALRSGERIPLSAPASAIEEAIESALRAPASLRPSALARGGRDAREWVRSLRELGGGADYRAARVPRDVLWATLEDPSAEAAARAAAAVALAHDLDAHGKERLRVAADDCAEARVRVAATLAAEDADDEALAEALRQCGG